MTEGAVVLQQLPTPEVALLTLNTSDASRGFQASGIHILHIAQIIHYNFPVPAGNHNP